MTRSVHVSEDLRGVTVNSTESFLYVGGCTLGERNGVLTTFTGDCTAADFINNIGPADYSQADLYAGYWRGNNLEGSKFPANIGYMQLEPIVEIARQGQAGNRVERAVLDGMRAWGVSDYSLNSWSTAWSEYASKIPGMTVQRFIAAITVAFADYPQLRVKAQDLGRRLTRGTLVPMTRQPSKVNIELDGTKVILDSQNLPILSRPQDRFELARTIHPDLFLYSIDPPVSQTHGQWKKFRRAGW